MLSISGLKRSGKRIKFIWGADQGLEAGLDQNLQPTGISLQHGRIILCSRKPFVYNHLKMINNSLQFNKIFTLCSACCCLCTVFLSPRHIMATGTHHGFPFPDVSSLWEFLEGSLSSETFEILTDVKTSEAAFSIKTFLFLSAHLRLSLTRPLQSFVCVVDLLLCTEWS